MAQYRSQWTGEVIDTAVGNAKDLAFVEIGRDAAGALEKCKKAFGVSALYGIGDYDPLVYLSANLYHCISGGIYGGHEYWFARLRGTRLTLYKLYEANNVAYWDGPIITDYAEADDVKARLRGADAAFNCRYDTSSYNIEAGQYVFWKAYLWIATKNIAVGDTLASTGANKNLERVSNGGLNDLKSALVPLEGIAVDNASVLQTVASQLKEGAITGVNTTLQTTDIPYTNIFSGWAVKFGPYITILLCNTAGKDMYVNVSASYGNVWNGWQKIATNADYVHSVTPGTNVTINTGGYIKTDRIVQVSLKLTLTADVSTNAVLVSGLPSSSNNVYINIGSGYNTNAYGCRTGQDKLYTNGNIPSGAELNLNYSYISG